MYRAENPGLSSQRSVERLLEDGEGRQELPCSACVPSVTCSATEYELQKVKSEFAESSEQANREILTLKEKVKVELADTD